MVDLPRDSQPERAEASTSATYIFRNRPAGWTAQAAETVVGRMRPVFQKLALRAGGMDNDDVARRWFEVLLASNLRGSKRPLGFPLPAWIELCELHGGRSITITDTNTRQQRDLYVDAGEDPADGRPTLTDWLRQQTDQDRRAGYATDAAPYLLDRRLPKVKPADDARSEPGAWWEDQDENGRASIRWRVIVACVLLGLLLTGFAMACSLHIARMEKPAISTTSVQRQR